MAKINKGMKQVRVSTALALVSEKMSLQSPLGSYADELLKHLEARARPFPEQDSVFFRFRRCQQFSYFQKKVKTTNLPVNISKQMMKIKNGCLF